MPNPIDFLTLLFVIAAGIQAGLIGFFGLNLAEVIFGSYVTLAYEVVGVSAVWQLLRQKFR
jgi:uncharacterized membrane protein YuzA (DUF378 family)